MKTLIILIAFLASSPTFATKLTAVVSGDWDDDSTWDLTAPGCYDSICIPEGITVTVNAQENLEGCPPVLIFVDGELHFKSGKKLKLPCGDSAIIIEITGALTGGGGGGSSNYVSICGDVVWRAGDGDIIGGYILLPIEFCCFEGEIVNRKSYLTWGTLSELNNAGFEVQRSADGVNWETLGFVAGVGTSSASINYSYCDENPLIGVNYYRIVQFDFDGVSEVFDPILLSNLKLEKDLFIFPNPVTDGHLVIYSSRVGLEHLEFSLYSMAGRLVLKGVVPHFNGDYCIVKLPSDVQAGTYFIQIGIFTERVIIL